MEMKFRTFGWVQDPGKISNLRKTVEIFVKNSITNRKLRLEKIPHLINKENGRDQFIELLNSEKIILTYRDLVGTSGKTRGTAPCNGILQAAIEGQRRPYIGDWPADNFVRWAHTLGFINYLYEKDSFIITKLGDEYVRSTPGSETEYEKLAKAFLSYPPVIRILTLLENGGHHTKFDLGKNLGFVGENGFTSMPQNILIKTLTETKSPKEKNKIKTNWEGSSDKYARMICGWLQQLQWVEQKEKIVAVKFAGSEFTATFPHAYIITGKGLTALRHSKGKSRYKRIQKRVFWEMLATKGKERNYLRTRRAYILKFLKSVNYRTTIQIQKFLQKKGLKESILTIEDDIKGLEKIGLFIDKNLDQYRLADLISDFFIPAPPKKTKVKILELKEKCRNELKIVPHDYLSLIDIAFDSKQNRFFEMKTIQLLTEELGFISEHLGGSRKPDGVAYTKKNCPRFGIIIDTKAYSKGFHLSIKESDKMIRYIDENNKRDKNINPIEWWKIFPKSIGLFVYLFVSGEFRGEISNQLSRISSVTQTNGGAINAYNLLLLAEKVKSNNLTLCSTLDMFSENKEIQV